MTVTYPDYEKLMRKNDTPNPLEKVGFEKITVPDFSKIPQPEVVQLTPGYKDAVERSIIEACNTLAQTLITKRRDYGPGNIGKHGEFGILVRLDDKLTRIDNLRKNGATPANESVGDSWLDAAGYSIIGYLFTQGKW